jgi:hypothetical protein
LVVSRIVGHNQRPTVPMVLDPKCRLHDLDLESYSGAHRVAPEATSELKAQVEAKFHMCCFVLC